ncbi:MAG: hypothetical protein WH035_00890, partial [Spirochaetota bacterium]
MSFINFFLDLFNPKADTPYAKLKKIKKEIKDFSPKYYNPNKLIFYGSFAHDLYSFSNSCQYFEKPLSHLFLNKKVLETFILMLINIILPKEVAAYVMMLEKERVDEVIKKYGYENTEKYYKKMIQYIRSYLKPNIIKSIDDQINKIKQLYELSNHNYNELFLIFNPAFNSTQVKKSLNFNDIKISIRFISAFEDFSFLVANTIIDESILTPLLTYIKKYSEKDPTFNFDESRIKKEIQKIIKILNDKFSFSKFETILKALKEDVDYKIKIIPHNETYTQSLINDKIKNIENYLTVYKNNEKNKNIELIVKKLFNDIQIIKSEIYNEQVSTHFSSNLLPALNFVKPYEVFRTFIVYYWEGKIKGNFNSFIFKAQYTDDSLKENINNLFHEGSSFIDKVNETEESFEDLKKYYSFLQKKPDSILKSTSQKNNMINVIMNANKKIQSILIQGLTFLSQLNLVLDIIINQVESKDQSKIANLLMIVDITTFKNLKIYQEKVKQAKNLLESLIQY